MSDERSYILRPDTGPDLSFTGRCIASVSSYEDGRDQWSVLRVYRTARGAFVAERERWALGDDGKAQLCAMSCGACADERAVVQWFHGGQRRASWLTKELLDLAGISHAEEV